MPQLLVVVMRRWLRWSSSRDIPQEGLGRVEWLRIGGQEEGTRTLTFSGEGRGGVAAVLVGSILEIEEGVFRGHVGLMSVVSFGCPPPCAGESNGVIGKTGCEGHVDDAEEDENDVDGWRVRGRGWGATASRSPKPEAEVRVGVSRRWKLATAWEVAALRGEHQWIFRGLQSRLRDKLTKVRLSAQYVAT